VTMIAGREARQWAAASRRVLDRSGDTLVNAEERKGGRRQDISLG